MRPAFTETGIEIRVNLSCLCISSIKCWRTNLFRVSVSPVAAAKWRKNNTSILPGETIFSSEDCLTDQFWERWTERASPCQLNQPPPLLFTRLRSAPETTNFSKQSGWSNFAATIKAVWPDSVLVFSSHAWRISCFTTLAQPTLAAKWISWDLWPFSVFIGNSCQHYLPEVHAWHHCSGRGSHGGVLCPWMWIMRNGISWSNKSRGILPLSS